MLPRSSVSTIVGVAIMAYALCDLVHEVLGHGLAASMMPGIQLVSALFRRSPNR
jgi:hypothetical protein